jgi:hypothetical protein
MHKSPRLPLALAAATAVLSLFPTPTSAVTDWDLYSLRIVNRARTDPAGEAARIGSGTIDNSAPVAPLGYQLLVETAATNHSNWMLDNLGNLPQSNLVPDSFTHYETLNGLDTGTPATGTPSYTGADLGTRMTNAGYAWSSVAENIIIAYSTASNAFTINQARVDAFHKGWWESTGHRTNMLSSSNTAYGVHFDTRNITAQQATDANFGAFPARSAVWGTEEYARPLNTPRQYISGLFFKDLDASGGWNPHVTGPTQEGFSAVTYQILNQSTSALVTSGTTSAVGSFATPVATGTYKLAFTIPNGTYTVQNIALTTNNSTVLVPDIDRAVIATGSILDVTQLPDPALTVNGRAIVKPTTAGGAGVNYLSTLTMGASGALDLNDNDLVINSAAFSTIQSLVFAGYSTTPDSTKTGITSTTGQAAAGVTILSLFDNALFGVTEYPFGSSHTLSPTAIVGKYTYLGDTDWDGQVTPQDYTAIDANLGATNLNPGEAWFSGDTDFDNNITPQDYTGIDANLGSGVGNPLATQALSSTPPVPEPTTLALILSTTAFIATRRRTRRPARFVHRTPPAFN